MSVIKLVSTLYARFRNLILYGFIGSCTASFDFLLFTALTLWTSIHYIVANIISCSLSILCSFLLNRKYNFKVADYTMHRMIIFFIVGVCGLFLSSIILRFCIDSLKLGESVSKLASIVIAAIVQFLLNKYISFKKIQDGKQRT